MDDFPQLLSRSHDFSEALLAAINEAEAFAAGEREEAAFAACELVFEHAFALRVLFEADAPNSAVVLLRVQFEALIRAAWLLHAATDLQLEKMTVPLTPESAAAAKNIPGADKMLTSLVAAMEAEPNLRGLVMPLKELKDNGWVVMNAFVHGGLHPIARTQEGFPARLATDVLKLSNGVLFMGARLLARLGGSLDIVQRVELSYLGCTDILPVVTAPT